MHFVRLVFNLKNIYFNQTTTQILYLYVILGAFLWLGIALATSNANFPASVLAFTFLIYLYMLARSILRLWLVNQYLKQYPDSIIRVSPGEIGHSSMNLELDKFDHLKPIENFEKANLFIAIFDFYKHSKYGDYLAKQAYYTVLELPLKRKLPHILFDSRSAKKRQFQYLYLGSQKISVQGTFDQVFDTYAPQTYHIDSISFVSPEVMEVLVNASMYDIEIINDRVLIYAPLMDKEDLEDLVSKGKAIAKHLDDNIDTYQDSRLSGAARVKEVTAFGRALLKSPTKYLMIASITGALTIDIIYWGITSSSEYRDSILFNEISFLIYITFITNVWTATKIMRQNKRAEERFRMLYHTNRGKPIKGK